MANGWNNANRLHAVLVISYTLYAIRSQEPVRHCPFYCDERSATICFVLGQKKSSMYSYSSEYTSGFSRPAASYLAAPPSPRHEGNVGQAPSFPPTSSLQSSRSD